MDESQLGAFTMQPSGDVIAGSIGSWVFTFTVGSAGLKSGGSVRLLIPNGFSPPIVLPKGWPPADNEPNANDIKEFIPADLGFVTVRCSQPDCRLTYQVMDPDESFKHAVLGQNGRFLFATIEEGFLAQGDCIEFTYGDPVPGSAGAVTPAISHTMDFSFAVDPDGSHKGPVGGFWPLKKIPRVRSLGGALTTWNVVVSSQPDDSGEIRGSLVPRDRYGNVSSSVKSDLTVKVAGEAEKNLSVDLKGWITSHPLPASIFPEGHGTIRIEVIDNSHNLRLKSNPVRKPQLDQPNIYWGDLHCHIAPDFSESLAEELYLYGRDASCLDFCAFTPHEDFPVKLTDNDWQMAQKVTDKYHEPGRFVTFYGYEYRNRGDYIVLYQQEGEPYFKGMVPTTNTPEKLFEFLAREVKSKVMLIPHLHYLPAFQESDSGIGVLDVNDLSSELIRNVEMYSMHGSAEYPGCIKSQSGAILRGYSPRVSDILAAVRGGKLTLGFTGATDTHTAHPGGSKWLRNRVQYPGGVTAVLAEDLSRESIWDGLWNHRTYATTGSRMIIDLAMREEGQDPVGMGQTLPVVSSAKPLQLHVEVAGTDKISRLVVVKGGTEVFSQSFDKEIVVLDWKDVETPTESTFYYVRIEQNDGHLAWTSPVWVDVE